MVADCGLSLRLAGKKRESLLSRSNSSSLEDDKSNARKVFWTLEILWSKDVTFEER